MINPYLPHKRTVFVHQEIHDWEERDESNYLITFQYPDDFDHRFTNIVRRMPADLPHLKRIPYLWGIHIWGFSYWHIQRYRPIMLILNTDRKLAANNGCSFHSIFSMASGGIVITNRSVRRCHGSMRTERRGWLKPVMNYVKENREAIHAEAWGLVKGSFLVDDKDVYERVES